VSNSHRSFELRESAATGPTAAEHSLTHTSRARLRASVGEGLRLTPWLTFPADGQTCFSNLT
jgi:hypothetical protein